MSRKKVIFFFGETVLEVANMVPPVDLPIGTISYNQWADSWYILVSFHAGKITGASPIWDPLDTEQVPSTYRTKVLLLT